MSLQQRVDERRDVLEDEVRVCATALDHLRPPLTQQARHEHGSHPHGACATVLVAPSVAHEEGVASVDADLLERTTIDRRVRLANPHLAREDRDVESRGER